MRLAWLPQNLRSSLRTRRRPSGNRLRVRQLERRRVLAASVTDIFFAPADLDPGTAVHDSSEGSQITATADASGTGPLTYGWQLSQGDTVITQSTSTSFVFTPPDDGVYTVSLKVTDSAQTAASHSEEIIVHNVAPELTNVVGDTIHESQTADIFVTIVDPGALDVFEIDVDWKDGDPIDTITGLGSTDASGIEGNTAYEWTALTRQLKLSHQFLDDNPTGTTSDTYHVTLVARDNAMGESQPVVANVVVNNVRPVLHVAPDQMVNEGETLDLSGMGAPPLAVFIDPGLEDTFTVTVDWGDGSPLGTPTIFQGVGAGALGATHVYADDGVYEVKVTVTDDDGGMDMQSFFVTVKNVPPVLHVAPDQMVNEGAVLDLSGMGAPPLGVFIDPGLLDTHTVTVNWGDGTPTETPTVFPGVGSSALGGTHIYADDGVYKVTVTVTDNNGGSDTESFFVTVKNVVPTIDDVEVSALSVEEGATFTITAMFSDPGFNNPLNPNPAMPPGIVDPRVESFTYDIDWGDGRDAVTGVFVMDVTNGGPGVLTTGSFGGSHVYADDGVYTVTLRVRDDNGGEAVHMVMITVTNVAPTLVLPNGDQTISEGQTLTLADLATFTDPGFDNPNNPNLPVLPDIADPKNESFTYDIDWGDGRDPIVGASVADLNGGPGTPSSGTIAGSHTYADDGVYTVTVTIYDDNGGNHTQTFTVTVSNVDPTLSVTPSTTTISEGGSVSFDAMFSDPGFDNPLNPTTPTTGDPHNESFTFDVDWGDGRDAIVGMSVADINGGVGVDSTGMFGASHTYADDGVYTVTVTIYDDNGGSHSQMFTVTVLNVDPTLSVTPSATTINEGGSVSFDAIFSDPGFDNPLNPTTPSTGDPFNESFTFDVDWGDGRDAILGMSVADLSGSPGTPSTGMFGANHTYADDGIYTVTVTIYDDNGGSHTQTFTVTVNNVDPTLSVTPSAATIDEGSTVSFEAIFSDPGFDNPFNPTTPATGNPFNESFTFDVDWGDGRDAIVGMSVADLNGGPGTPSTGMFGGSHTYSDDGVYTVTVTIYDDNGGSHTQTFDVTVLNVVPTLSVTPSPTTIDEGSSVSFEAIFSDPGFDNPLNPTTPSTGDPFNESFTYFVDWGDGRDQIGSASLTDIDGSPGVPTTGTFGGNHTYADDGTYTVIIRIADDNMSGNFAMGTAGVDFVEQTFTVIVNNVQPTLALTPGAAQVNEGSSFSFTAAFSDPGFDNPNNPTTPATGNPFAESFRYYVDWGDGRDQVPDQGVADINGSPGVPSTGSFGGNHVYADNGTYTVTVRIADDNMTGNFATGTAGVDFVEQTFTIVVNNVDPTLTGTTGLVVNEGQQFTLIGLGVGIADPGFDNPLNTLDPANGGELTETFEVMRINWGDGNVDDNTDGDASDPIAVVNRVSGGVGVMTTAQIDHALHAYADNGTYTVTITLRDDDGNFVDRQFTIQVNNVAPTLTLTTEAFVINEGSVLFIPNLGAFTDPGFNNPLNPNVQPGGSVETFSYTIDWGDGTPVVTGQLPTSVVNGAQGVLTTGALGNSHFYADNDADNKYTITVTLMDDDGGVDVQSFEITVHNVNPTLQPVFATDIDAKTASTTLTLTFFDPGADSFEILVDWGDKLGIANPADRFVVAATYDGGTPQIFVLTHVYDGPPDPDHPTADIVITVKIRDDDFQTLGVIQPGESNLEVVAISNPGIQTTNVAIDTTPDVPRLDLTVQPTAAVYVADQAAAAQVLQRQDVRGSGGEVAATTERYLEIRLVYPDGSESEGYRIKDDALLDLRAFFKTLPDGRYRIYLVRSETRVPRLVIEVDVRRGRVVDISDESEGTRDRPPTGETESEAVPLEQNPLLEAVPPEENRQGDGETRRQGEEDGDLRVSLSPLAALAQPWSQRLDRAFAEADDHTARRLRRAGRIRRHLAPLLRR